MEFKKENNEVVGLIALRDELKDNIALLMKKLNENNIETIMLTGDNSKAANIIAKECNINTVISEVLPNQKGEVIKSLQNNNKIVAMVGDGINDAIALTTSDVGIAIGTGTDIAIESSDVVLMGNDIVNIIYAIKLSKKVVNTIKMNLFWAFIYNVLFIPVAAGALYYPFNIVLNPMLCAIAMCLSSLCVVLNALRINKFRKE